MIRSLYECIDCFAVPRPGCRGASRRAWPLQACASLRDVHCSYAIARFWVFAPCARLISCDVCINLVSPMIMQDALLCDALLCGALQFYASRCSTQFAMYQISLSILRPLCISKVAAYPGITVSLMGILMVTLWSRGVMMPRCSCESWGSRRSVVFVRDAKAEVYFLHCWKLLSSVVTVKVIV